MLTKQDWTKREDLRLSLAELITKSPLKEALEVCLSQEVDKPSLEDARVNLTEQLAIRGAKREGYFDFYKQLLSLTKEYVPPKPLSEPWSHAQRKQTSDE